MSNALGISLDWMRALLATALIASAGFMAAQPTYARAEQPTIQAADSFSILQWAVREGGSVAIVLFVLYFYRRDWKRLNEETAAANRELVALVQANTTAMHSVVASNNQHNEVLLASVNRNTEATHRLARSVEQVVFKRARGNDD